TKATRATIHYTLDGSMPDTTSSAYQEPFHIHNTAEVKCILRLTGWTDSEVATRTFAKSRFPIAQLKTNVAPNEKYAAQGVQTLIDLQKGTNAFSDGKWLGFQENDVTITADLGSQKDIHGVTIGTLSDFGSYIHLPLAISVQTSTDGKRFYPFQEKRIPLVKAIPTEAQVFNHYLSAPPTVARFLRIVLKHQKVNPPWHPAPEAPCWLFVDEILVE
ncbi:MAG: FN3 associated domain-containing protein, partial [Bacteroidota bacterium]